MQHGLQGLCNETVPIPCRFSAIERPPGPAHLASPSMPIRRLVIALLAVALLPVADVAAATWRPPVEGAVTRAFDPGSHPFEGGRHRGVDLAAPPGTEVHAPCTGRVAFAGRVGSNGRVVTLRCGRLAGHPPAARRDHGPGRRRDRARRAARHRRRLAGSPRPPPRRAPRGRPVRLRRPTQLPRPPHDPATARPGTETRPPTPRTRTPTPTGDTITRTPHGPRPPHGPPPGTPSSHTGPASPPRRDSSPGRTPRARRDSRCPARGFEPRSARAMACVGGFGSGAGRSGRRSPRAAADRPRARGGAGTLTR